MQKGIWTHKKKEKDAERAEKEKKRFKSVCVGMEGDKTGEEQRKWLFK